MGWRNASVRNSAASSFEDSASGDGASKTTEDELRVDFCSRSQESRLEIKGERRERQRGFGPFDFARSAAPRTTSGIAVGENRVDTDERLERRIRYEARSSFSRSSSLTYIHVNE